MNPTVPDVPPTDERAETIAGLRELLDFLEAHPVIPLGTIHPSGYTCYPRNREGQNVAGGLAELRAIGEAIGEELFCLVPDHVYVTGPTFRGGVQFDAVVCGAGDLFRQQNETAAGAADKADTAPAVGGEAIRGADPSVPGPTTPGAGDTPKTLQTVEHYHTGGTVGGIYDTSAAECACGVEFAGFDTYAEAVDVLNAHIADAIGASL